MGFLDNISNIFKKEKKDIKNSEQMVKNEYDEDGTLRAEKIEKMIGKEKIITTKAYDYNEIDNYTIREEHFNKNGEIKQDRFSSYEGIDNLKYIRDEKIERESGILKTSITEEHYDLGKLIDKRIEETTKDKNFEIKEIKVFNGNNLYSEEFSKTTEREFFNSLKQYRENGGIIFDYESTSGNGKSNTVLNFYDKEGNLLGDTQYSNANDIIGVGKYNENGEKEGFWCERNFISNGYLGILETKDVEDFFEQSGSYVNGKKEGKWRFYNDYEIGDPYSKQCLYRTEAEFKGGKLDGKVSIFSIDSNREEKKLLDLEYKENSLTSYKCYDYVPDHIELPNSSYSAYYHSPYNKTLNFSTEEYAHKITIEENGNTIIENYKENLLESKHIIDIEGNIKNLMEYSKDVKTVKEIDNQENKTVKEAPEKKNPWAKSKGKDKEAENER